ncbi:hypothetical protein TEA_011732 [Camellia sinensis var. sinensis]|uniref:Uncharacterized protein n=1 Tax=Camellia sinensis var. sinensis TaxID=542762 RepID=A0A4S4DG47_CAMSN|nr:hypothetical protein TEA_011732 [Camellia sinensis var. sinensis]
MDEREIWTDYSGKMRRTGNQNSLTVLSRSLGHDNFVVSEPGCNFKGQYRIVVAMEHKKTLANMARNTRWGQTNRRTGNNNRRGNVTNNGSGSQQSEEIEEQEQRRAAKMSRKGPPKHQNKFAWKPNAGVKINETEVGGKFRPLSDVTGVCHRCKDQIEWKRKYGKYKPLTEPAKWDISEVEAEQKMLDEAIKNARERDRRTLLRAMNKGKSLSSTSEKSLMDNGSKAGELLAAESVEEDAESSRDDEDDNDIEEDEVKVLN